METALMLMAAIIALGAVYVLLPLVIHTFQRFRRRKVVTCPETEELVEVTLKAKRAALASAFHKPLLRVKNCTLWPKKKGCEEECVKENWES
jgi:hypothetical protein